jgi:hypothetical protein
MNQVDLKAWGKWVEYRKQIRKPYKSESSIELAQKKLASFGEWQMQVVEQSIERSWTGLFELPKKTVAALERNAAAENLERRKLRELHERGIEIGFRAPLPNEDSALYKMLLERFEHQKWQKSRGVRSIGDLLTVKS